MTATVDASPNTNAALKSTNNDGGGLGFSFTTPTGMSGKRVLCGVGVSSNANVITAPGSGTWAQVTLPDNVITTSGGQLRIWEGSGLADSTTYTFSFTGGRQTCAAVVIGGFDATGGSMVDVASSLESAAGSTHAPPSVTPNAAAELVVDFLMFRQFAPDNDSTCVPPVSGLTWTEDFDGRGADGNNNIQMCIAHATAGSSGVAVSTAPWSTNDPNEPTLVARILIKSAAGGSTEQGAAALSAAPALTAGAVRDQPGTTTLAAAPTLTVAATGIRVGAAALSAAPTLAAAATRDQPAAVALAATPALTADATRNQPAAAALTVAPALAVAANATTGGAADLAASPTMAATGDATAPAAATLTAAPTLVAAAQGGNDAVAALAAAPLLTAAATPQRQAVAVLAAAPVLAASGHVETAAAAALTASPTLTAAGDSAGAAAAALTATPVLAASAAAARAAGTSLTAHPTLVAAASSGAVNTVPARYVRMRASRPYTRPGATRPYTRTGTGRETL
ncbi:hypothetical protein ACFFX1_54970 [Dactylosporangium sucinum]|uniref:Uncharacterized protein n=1 Tax=Dactylosporangium sucinum TaxID=1424081 RepID=A0A917X254_9ACTN|nr:hypothetical protein [Dactylosporangium sucinum]GGM53305.1 hypothetical protein GCM10007977_063660 [Dactylosporangium sucinum]